MTREDVLAVAGPFEVHFVVEILEAGGRCGDLVEAMACARGCEVALSAGGPPVSATNSNEHR